MTPKRLADVKVDLSEEAAVTVVLASDGYPGPYGTGAPIEGLAAAAGAREAAVFHSGTAERDGRVVTAGGRVLAVSGWGPALTDARARAYDAASHISFDGMMRRSDIAARGSISGPTGEKGAG